MPRRPCITVRRDEDRRPSKGESGFAQLSNVFNLAALKKFLPELNRFYSSRKTYEAK